MTAVDRAPVTTGEQRLPGPDVARAVALIGVVVLNYHGYLLLRHDTRGDDAAGAFFDPWTGPMATRFAATFVLVAGVGVTMFTRRVGADRHALAAKRWTLVRRGLTLYGGGLVLDMIWPGTILPYYGVMFVLAAVLCALRSRWLVGIGTAAALTAAAIAWWGLERRRDGGDPSWLFAPGPGSPRGLLFDVAVNGTHPLLPWLAFFCAGIVLGRCLTAPAWRPIALAAGYGLFTAATLAGAAAGDGAHAALLSTHPASRSLVYTASALGTALVAFALVTWVAERAAGSAAIRLLGDAGAMTLTLYVGHALVFVLLVDELGWVRPTGLDTALLFAGAYWAVAITATAAWHRAVGIGPLEWLYRRLGG